jgi:hypothetical protein
MGRRIQYMNEKNKGGETYCKMMMNAAYGFDGLNEENYVKVGLKSKENTFRAHMRNNFLGTRQITDNLYLVSHRPNSYGCKTCIQEAYFTLDNAKFWYLNAYYNFFKKAFDFERIHYIEGDTDSAYFAVAGDAKRYSNLKETEQLMMLAKKGSNFTDEDNDYITSKKVPCFCQGFESVVKDQTFYDAHKYKFFPDPTKGKEDEKKLLGLAVEKEGDVMIAIAPKNYKIDAFDSKANKFKDVLKNKGVSKRNTHISGYNYDKCISEGSASSATNVGFHFRSGRLVKDELNKIAITGIHSKMIVLRNQSCAPFIYGMKPEQYIISEP